MTTVAGRLAAAPHPSPNLVDVWLAPPTAELAAAALPLLSAEERARDARFQHTGARQQFLVGRWLLRTVLAERLGTTPAAVPLVASERGALAVLAAANPAHLRFNLSHTEGLVAIALAAGCPVGVDVEDCERPGRTVALAERYFAPTEVAALRARPPAAQRDRFFQLWTLKEAYIKARGQGLAIPLARFAFDLDPACSAIGFTADADVDPDPPRWRFRTFRPTARHQLSVALCCGAEGPLVVSVRCLFNPAPR